jgi:hypothetical protein
LDTEIAARYGILITVSGEVVTIKHGTFTVSSADLTTLGELSDNTLGQLSPSTLGEIS